MEVVNTQSAPAVTGPYVQAVSTGKMVITSGQLPVDPESGHMSDAIEVQTYQSLQNVRAIVEAAGLNVESIIKTTVFVKNLDDFAAVNYVYEAFFRKHSASFPARSCVEVARLPRDAKIEIEALAMV